MTHLKRITMTKHCPARFDAALSQILGGQFLQRAAPWMRRITGFNDAFWAANSCSGRTIPAADGTVEARDHRLKFRLNAAS